MKNNGIESTYETQLGELRENIDVHDRLLVSILGATMCVRGDAETRNKFIAGAVATTVRRFELTETVGNLKASYGHEPYQEVRHVQVTDNLKKFVKEKNIGLNPEFIDAVWKPIQDQAVSNQEDAIASRKRAALNWFSGMAKVF